MRSSRDSKKPLSQHICRWLYILVKYLLAIALTAIMCIPAIYHLSLQHAHQVVNHPLHKSFSSPTHLALLQKLHSSSSSFLYGKDPKQIEHFVNFYAHGLALKGWRTVKWELDADIDIVDYVSVNDLKMGLEDFIDVENDEISTLWVVILNGRKQKLWQITDLVRRYSDDRFVVINQKKEKIPGSVGSFQYLKIPQIPRSDFEKALMEHLNITAFQSSVLIRHYGSIHSTFQQVHSQCADLHGLLGTSYHQLTSKQSKKDLSDLKKLCASGKLKQRQQSMGMNRMGAFFYDGWYYWRDIQSALNFELQIGDKIKGAQQGCKYIDSELRIWQIPVEPINEDDENQQEKKTRNKDYQSYEWNLEENEDNNKEQDKDGKPENTPEDNQEQNQDQDDHLNGDRQGDMVLDYQADQQVSQEDQQYKQIKSDNLGRNTSYEDDQGNQQAQLFDSQGSQENQKDHYQDDQQISQNQPQETYNPDESEQNGQSNQRNETSNEQIMRQDKDQSTEQAQADHQKTISEKLTNDKMVEEYSGSSNIDKREQQQQNNHHSHDKQAVSENYEYGEQFIGENNVRQKNQEHDQQEYRQDQGVKQKVQQVRSTEHPNDQPVLVDSAL